MRICLLHKPLGMDNRKLELTIWILIFFLRLPYSFCVSTTTTTATVTTTASTPSTISPTTTPQVVTESNNNVLWLIIGIVCGVVLVLGIVIGVAVAFCIHKSKRIHPHSDTDSIYSTESPSESRPTTASHIHFDPEPEEEAMSKPVTMTPFELRKLYIETFPYKNWRRGYDGSLRPKMSLQFVDPRIYAKTKGDERNFREKIYNYEMSDSLTLRSSALSRMMHHSILPTMSEMEPVSERQVPPIAHTLQEQLEPTCVDLPEENKPADGSRADNIQNMCTRSDDVELM